MSQPSLIVRADAGLDIGTGHVMRCFALSRAWRQRGGRVWFVSRTLPGGIAARLRDGGVEIATIAEDLTAEQEHMAIAEIITAERKQADKVWLLADGYHFDVDYFHGLKQLGAPLLVIDDLANLPTYPCELLMNPNIFAEPALYPEKLSGEAMLGTRFALIRDDLRARMGPTREHPAVARKLLIVLGGADPGGFSMMLTDAVAQASTSLSRQGGIEGRLIVGAANPRAEALTRSAPDMVSVHADVRDMAAMFQWCDMALSAAGSTVWEMSMFGVPMILAAQNDGEVRLADRLGGLGGCVYLGEFEHLTVDAVAGALAQDPQGRGAQSAITTGLVDGAGADRVVGRMLDLGGDAQG
jgi:UDP-2,4-diacetamido-2,4,6-trideoxy-beta-L-altropyranose hydrolase